MESGENSMPRAWPTQLFVHFYETRDDRARGEKTGNISLTSLRLHHLSLWAVSPKVHVLKTSQVLVAHAYNPSYSEGRDQKDGSSKSVWANSSQDTILKKTHHKKGLVEWLEV
jgi:hypothetical protein